MQTLSNSVKFRCMQSGNVVSFHQADEIESMRKEPHYMEVTENGLQEEIKETQEEVKKRGRPKK